MSRISKAALLAAGIVSVSSLVSLTAAQASVTVFGGDFAQACYQAARNGLSRDENIQDCNTAISTEQLEGHDLAGTYVNRGALYLAQHHWSWAHDDFQQALMVEPKLGEAKVNLGAAEIGMRENRQGIDDITAGLALGSQEPEKAYYNRALGYENLGDETDAYYDYVKASELKPDWVDPRNELVRFTVKPAQ
jgi:tetratricopeptide (TPR) repeat protein